MTHNILVLCEGQTHCTKSLSRLTIPKPKQKHTSVVSFPHARILLFLTAKEIHGWKRQKFLLCNECS
jgi:hypothetical protein